MSTGPPVRKWRPVVPGGGRGTPSSRPLRADARRNREALLSAARQAFLSGHTDAHVEDIARSAGVAVGTLYRHFDTREALIEEVYRKEVDDLCAAPDGLLDQHAPEEALRRFLLLLVDHAAVGAGMSVAPRRVERAGPEKDGFDGAPVRRPGPSGRSPSTPSARCARIRGHCTLGPCT